MNDDVWSLDTDLRTNDLFKQQPMNNQPTKTLTRADLPVGTKVTIPGTIHVGTVWTVIINNVDTVVVSDGVCTKKKRAEWLKLYTEPTNPTQSMKEYDEAQFVPIQRVLDGLQSIMQYKNRQYGNSGLSPIGVFSKQDTLEKLLARADDKVARIQNSSELRKNDVIDLMGYLTLICASKGWDNFDDQKD